MKIRCSLILLLVLSCDSYNKTPNTINTSISEEIEQEPALKKSIALGKEVYSSFCITCHLPNGKGVSQVFPPLAKSDYLMNKRQASIKAIKYGQSGKITVNGKHYNNVMASLGLEDAEIAHVMNYITNSWGNSNNKLITEEEVSKIEP